ncbi:helicase associated domain-containing protein [Streptomyces sp. NPDC091027]|uniref:helicase associated domain-containing protein n=1 Tax=Streptomyces sp. NPDC091027 TaxID=3365971 RepID=UPI0037F2C5EB
MVQTAPLPGEMSLSFLGRIAARLHLDVRDVLGAVVQVDTVQNLKGVLRADSEVYFNAAARARVAALCRMPEDLLQQALPAWARQEPSEYFRAGPSALLRTSGESEGGWGPACPQCVAARTGRRVAARRYLGAHQRVCARHRSWLMGIAGTGGRCVDLTGCPEVVQAQGRHRRLLRRSPTAAEAFEVAQAVTASWWAQWWPEELLWRARLEASMPAGEDPQLWRILARELVTYPETVAIAALLCSRGWRKGVVADAGGHLPYRLADVPLLLSGLSRSLRRPWLAARLADCTHGPLFFWTCQCARTRGGEGDEGGQGLWQVPLTHQPRRVADDLVDFQRNAFASVGGLPDAKRLRGHSRQADRSFAVGLAHARVYADGHGHLAVRRDTSVDSFPLGVWVRNQQTRALLLPAEKAGALEALDPWWNVPWSVKWQRSYYRARDHVRQHGPLDAAGGFPGTHVLTGEWLYLQCADYEELHPEQRRLLAGIGLSAEVVSGARPRRPSRSAGVEAAVACARDFASQYGSLALATRNTIHQGFLLGSWLIAQRPFARREDEGGRHLQALDAIDRWWNPPWSLAWQRTWQLIRSHAHVQRTGSADEAWPDGSAGWAAWLSQQCVGYAALHPQQQRLLAEIGITPARAATRPHEIIDRLCRTGPGLAHARSYATEHGHLAVPQQARYQGFGLGRWLSEHRRRGREHERSTGGSWPAGVLLATLDPWWNPPWPLPWQRTWTQVHRRAEAGSPTEAGTGFLGLEGELAGWLA